MTATRLLTLVLLAALAALPQAVMAQGQQSSGTPKDLAVAPQAAGQKPEARTPAAETRSGGPANICRELVAYLQPKPSPAPTAGQAPASSAQAAAPQAPASAAAGQPQAAQPGPNPASSAAGPAVQASGQPAPVQNASAPAKAPPVSLQEASALADKNDLPGCQKAAQKLRRAGIDLPPGLIALAALKPELLGPGQR